MRRVGSGVVGRRKEMVGRGWQVPLPKARLKSITGQLWGVALWIEKLKEPSPKHSST